MLYFLKVCSSGFHFFSIHNQTITDACPGAVENEKFAAKHFFFALLSLVLFSAMNKMYKLNSILLPSSDQCFNIKM